MKYLIAILSVALFACNSSRKTEISSYQKEFQKKIIHYDSLYNAFDIVTNPMTKDEYKDSIMRSFDNYLSDSTKRLLRNFRVKLESLEVKDVQDVRAFYAQFSDEDYNTYWLEFDYNRDSIKYLQDNPAYKLIKNIPKNVDTALSFFYVGDLEWDHPLGFKMRVVPFPKNYNFDSSIRANQLSAN